MEERECDYERYRERKEESAAMKSSQIQGNEREESSEGKREKGKREKGKSENAVFEKERMGGKVKEKEKDECLIVQTPGARKKRRLN